MSFWTFVLLGMVFGWIAFIQLLNSSSKAGELARVLALGLIDRLVGRREEKSGLHENSEEPPTR